MKRNQQQLEPEPVIFDERIEVQEKPEQKEEPELFRWSSHFSISLTPKALDEALWNAGLKTPETMLKNSHKVDDVLRGLLAVEKGKLLDIAKQNRATK